MQVAALCFPVSTAWRELCVRRVQSTSLLSSPLHFSLDGPTDADWSTEGTAAAAEEENHAA